ncbi:MAG TPA: cytochrome c [Sinorhizobium sp.]|nr:cytochrome c [Sinorhizobium sp.]
MSVAAAQTVSPEQVVQRQHGMKAMAQSAKTINAMFQGTSPYDARVFKAAAETIKAQSGTTLSALFDGSAVPADSKASAAIGLDRPAFDKLAGELRAYASALSIAADRNPDMLGPEMRMRPGDAAMGGPFARKAAVDAAASMPAEHAFHLLLQTCTSCHARFRTDGN